MSLAIVNSQALQGVSGTPVRVEVHVGAGLPAFHIVGLPDAGVRESRERVRAAIVSSGFEFPAGRVTVNLAPADLPKESGRFDLAIALGVLLASGQVQDAQGKPPRVDQLVFVGELSLTGAIASVAAPLAIALSVARTQAGVMLVLPEHEAAQAAWVPGLDVRAVASLAQAVAHLAGQHSLSQAEPLPMAERVVQVPCLSEVRGQQMARRVLEIAAAGGHSLLMCGPPGVGKSMLAQRLPGLLPPLSAGEALEHAAIAALKSGEASGLSTQAPFRAPHHSSSLPALVGGGSYPRPGEISLAHHGVLFLDELPQFQPRVLEALREPLETREVTIARAQHTHRFPAAFQLVAAMNPCPCGWLGHGQQPCRCAPDRIQAYRGRISGPLLDRMDLHITLPALKAEWMEEAPGEGSQIVRQRVLLCRERQSARQQTMNARLDAGTIRQHCHLNTQAQELLQAAMQRWHWSARVVHRVLRVARTVADLSGRDDIIRSDVAEAMQYRQAWPGDHH
ncbi:YifB family Mg chelatase-like AAA ATPase [Pusillimonas sp. CC-YST705]|uniref:YifB family Mg chelatase-like AAA ATPase n=1 Tax=Mesopusillimonas faecipullorum TaxID=2755040 RepID=A0ABS8CBV3_9BURK|nr:YifB family Mg chelatase-like AAA ATPase [Mesopusillimonas faecipullorum]MCB5363332.1 YifB family Mg chelatase-like AAA ATPase [Mesopusillimonas faecipullorum]